MKTATILTHSGNRRHPAPQRSCGSPLGNAHTNAPLSPEVSPEASGRLWECLA
jgi:hypothetical protein